MLLEHCITAVLLIYRGLCYLWSMHRQDFRSLAAPSYISIDLFITSGGIKPIGN